jgi:uncharacterized protein YceK
MRKHSLILALVGATLASGCGTVVNFRYPSPEPYGGVKNDLQQVRTLMDTGWSGEYRVGTPVFGVFLVADTCVSAITDTLTLPLVFILGAQKLCSAVAPLPR